MSFRPKYLSEWKLRTAFLTKASTLLPTGAAVVQSTGDSGQLVVCGTTSDSLTGISQKTKPASDATTDPVPVLVPVAAQATVVVTSASGTLTPGTTCDIASGGLTIDAGASNEDIFTITRGLTSTSCEGYFNNPAPTRA